MPIEATLVVQLASAVSAEPRVPLLQHFWNKFLEAVGNRMTQYDPETAIIVWKAVRSLLSDGPDDRNGLPPSEALNDLDTTTGNLGFTSSTSATEKRDLKDKRSLNAL